MKKGLPVQGIGLPKAVFNNAWGEIKLRIAILKGKGIIAPHVTDD